MAAPVKTKTKLFTRIATTEDIPGIIELTTRAYPDFPPYTEEHLRGQINNFPQGQFIAIFEERIAGYCASFRISGDLAFRDHDWKEITGSGFGSRHDPLGDYLYGYEICVDPNIRGYRLGKRLYEARKQLCQFLRLKGIIIVGRLPQLKKKFKTVGSPEEYIKRVERKEIRDNVYLFQTRNGFDFKKLLKNYLPSDEASMGYGALMVWRNPQTINSEKEASSPSYPSLPKNKVRLAVVQYKQRKVESFEQFSTYVEYFVDVAAGYDSDFIVFPEWFTLQLLSLETNPTTPAESIRALEKYTPRFQDEMHKYAIKYNVNIIGGSTAIIDEDKNVRNVAFAFLRDGRVFKQEKIHPTPNESYWWNLKGGNAVRAIDTDCGPIGILICYDAEFPELVRHLVNQGVKILFVPFCTDERKSYLRVRYCAQARAVENQMYVAMAGNVGNLPGVENMDIQYAQSCILTPCDFPFARDGIAADTTPNVETVAFADLHLDDLAQSRANGTVRNLRDRRHDLYQIVWRSH